MFDLYNNLSVTQALSAGAATTTQTSSAIDLQGFYSALVVFNLGTSGDTLSGSLLWTLKLQESDTSGSGYTDVTTDGLLGSPSTNTVVVDLAGKDATAYKFGYQGGKRYLKAVATPTGSLSSGMPIGVVAVRGTPSLAPTA